MWEIEKEKALPIYVSIMKDILKKIEEGVLLSGTKLPPERQLAKFIGVNRSTVVHALEELEAMGVVERIQGSGTVIKATIVEKNSLNRTNWHHYLEQNLFHKSSPFLEEMNYVKRTNKGALDFYSGKLPSDLVPQLEIPQMTLQEILSVDKEEIQGYLPLRETIIHQLEKIMGTSISPQELLLTTGAEQALFLISQVLLNSGESIAVERPSFLYSLPIFQALGIRLYGVSMDEEGICLEELEQTIRKHHVKMVLLNPTFQNPTGKTMSVKRREAVLALCRNYRVPIVEDDVYRNFSFVSQETIPPLKKLDSENVLYIGSLSKVFGSTMKIGWLYAPAKVCEQLGEARKVMDFSLGIFPQLMIHTMLTNPTYEQKFEELVQNIKSRSERMEELFQAFPEWRVVKSQGGGYLWAEWQGEKITSEKWRSFLALGLLVAPGFLYGSKKDAIRLNAVKLTQENERAFVDKLRRVTEQIKKL
ncbi:MAG: PLP-dependent aminotransferase family protein [Lactobacillales bacterium]|jgi:DNA-binding transcriptional MocR family regulator|nr:PLP-dependent aminotransferase family protein [Lactobacillales bacterium]